MNKIVSFILKFALFPIILYCFILSCCIIPPDFKMKYSYNCIKILVPCTKDERISNALFISDNDILFQRSSQNSENSGLFLASGNKNNLELKKIDYQIIHSFNNPIYRFFYISRDSLLLSLIDEVKISLGRSTKNYIIHNFQKDNEAFHLIKNDTNYYFYLEQCIFNRKYFYNNTIDEEERTIYPIDSLSFKTHMLKWRQDQDTYLYSDIDTLIALYRNSFEKKTIVEIYCSSTHKTIYTYKLPEILFVNGKILISPNYRFIALISDNDGLCIFDFNESKLYRNIIETISISCCKCIKHVSLFDWSNDSNKLLIYANDLCIINIDELINKKVNLYQAEKQ